MVYFNALNVGDVHLHWQQPLVAVGLGQVLEGRRATGVSGRSYDSVPRVLQKPAHRKLSRSFRASNSSYSAAEQLS